MRIEAGTTRQFCAAACVGACVAALPLAGCVARHASVADAFPVSAVAAPWILEGEIWSGTFAAAAPALGTDADQWRDPQPTHVWLAAYTHEGDRARRLIARAFEFETSAAARMMFDRVRPVGTKNFSAGESGCWTGDGVLFVWGRLVFDIFASQASWQNELQAAMLAQFIQKQMPPGLPDAPQ
jgi:hypothetical protein